MPDKLLNLTLILTVAACLLIPGAASAQTAPWAFGTMHSPKGFGFTAGQFCDGTRETFSLVADLNGVIAGESSSPGVRATYLHENDFLTAPCGFSDSFGLYYGIGACAGYVSDRDVQKGIMAGMSLAFGSRFIFPGCVSITLSLQADISLFASRDRVGNVMNLGLYRKGITRCYYPQLSINYTFR